MEGYNFDIVGEDISNYHCPICLMLLRNVIVLPCSHSTCETCLKNWGEKTGIFRCPSCQFAYDEDKVFEKNEASCFIDRLITTSLKVKCKHHLKSCEWVGTISGFELHENTCLHASVTCGYEGCDVIVCRKDLYIHQVQCPYKTIQCQFCSFYFPYNQLEDHHKSCDYFEVTCPQSCHDESMLRIDVQSHIVSYCPNVEIRCPFHEMGCTHVALRKDMGDHISNSIVQHTPLLLRFVFDLKTEIQQLKDISSSQKDEIGELTRSKLEQCAEIKILDEFTSLQKDEIEGLKRNQIEQQRAEIKRLNELTSLQKDEMEQLKKNLIEQCAEIKEWKQLITGLQIEIKETKESTSLKIFEKEKAVLEISKSNQEVEVMDKHQRDEIDFKIKDTACKGAVSTEDTAKKVIQAVQLREDGTAFAELRNLISKKEYKRFIGRINSEPELALVCNSYGQSLLLDACSCNNVSCMDVLLKHGCPITREDKYGFQPIHSAAANGSIDAAKTLLSIDETLVHNINPKNGMTPLHYGALRNQYEFVKFLLQQPGIKVDVLDHSRKTADRYGNHLIDKMIMQHRYKYP